MDKKRRFLKLQEQAQTLRDSFDELRDEIEDAQLNLPENLQNSTMAEKMQARFDACDEAVDSLDTIIEFDWSEPV